MIFNGIDVLQRDDFTAIEGHRVGLITNHTGLTHDERASVDLLHESKKVQLAALFGPEHGIRGDVDEAVADSRDPKTGLPVFSLYGAHKKPTGEMLHGLDMLVYDIQDVGCRFYTYISTLGLGLEAAAEASIPFVVLDRVNPINGVDVEGPIADDDRLSFTAYHPIPVRHGLTVGELAQLYNAEKKLNCSLVVVKCEGWRRSMWFDECGQYWINPSPNMRSLTQALLYPGIGLLETTNLSVGRGTDTPFEVVGAPWLNGARLAGALNDANLPGVRFVPIRFTPRSREFAGKLCEGVNMIITDRRAFRCLRTGLVFACTLRDHFGHDWAIDKYINLLADRKTMDSLMSGKSANDIDAYCARQCVAFNKRRTPILIYE